MGEFMEWVNSITAGNAATIGSIVACMAVFWRMIRGPLRKFNLLMDDLMGQPARPGFDATPGILERQKAVEDQMSGIRLDIATLVGKVDTVVTKQNHTEELVKRTIKGERYQES